MSPEGNKDNKQPLMCVCPGGPQTSLGAPPPRATHGERTLCPAWGPGMGRPRSWSCEKLMAFWREGGTEEAGGGLEAGAGGQR